MFWVNGELSQSISPADRSFQYGDGCFTTMQVCNGEIQFWPLHIERMESCLKVLGIPFPDWQRVELWLNNAMLNAPRSGLKLHISRGEGGRGYSPAQVTMPNITISHFHEPEHYSLWRATGVELGICRQRLGLNPLLAGHKHNNRLEQILMKAELELSGFVDGVALDLNHHVIETTMANLFWVKDGHLLTPKLDSAGVAGVARRVILAEAEKTGIPVMIDKFKLESLLTADEVFISNSILNVAPVKAITGHQYPVGQITRRIQENFHT